MPRRYREHHHHRRSSQGHRRTLSLTTAFRKPAAQVGVLLVVAVVVYLLLQMGGRNDNSLPRDIPASEAYKMYQSGALLLDVRTQEEWNEYHVPNTTLIPLDQLPARLGEVPRDRQVVVVCRSGNRSQQGRDLLLDAGFEQVTSMSGGLTEWRASGYPIEP